MSQEKRPEVVIARELVPPPIRLSFFFTAPVRYAPSLIIVATRVENFSVRVRVRMCMYVRVCARARTYFGRNGLRMISFLETKTHCTPARGRVFVGAGADFVFSAIALSPFLLLLSLSLSTQFRRATNATRRPRERVVIIFKNVSFANSSQTGMSARRWRPSLPGLEIVLTSHYINGNAMQCVKKRSISPDFASLSNWVTRYENNSCARFLFG